MRVFRAEDLEMFPPPDEELEIFLLCQPLQSCHCQLEFCGCVGVSSLCRGTRSRCLSVAFCKSGCVVAARVSPPLAVVLF